MVNHLVRVGDHEEFLHKFEHFVEIMNKTEASNVELTLIVSKLFARMSSNNPAILEKTINLLDKSK